MSVSIQVKPEEVRVYNGQGATRAFFNFDLGFTDAEGNFHGLFTSKDWTLLERNDGSGYFVKPFEKLMMKNGEPMLDAETQRPRRVELITKFFGEKGSDGKARPTKESYQFFDVLTEKVVAVYKAKTGINDSKRATVAASVGEQEPGTPFEDEKFPWEQ